LNDTLRGVKKSLSLVRLRSFAPLSAVKVPDVMAVFWIVKALTTGMGETASDSLVGSIEPAVTVRVGVVVVTITVVLPFAVTRYERSETRPGI